MSKHTLVVEAVLSSFRTLADGTPRLQMDCQEITPDKYQTLGYLNKRHGVLVFKGEAESSDLSEEEMEAIDSFDVGGMLKKVAGKSKSQIVRAVLYKYYSQEREKGEGCDEEVAPFQSFNSYYEFIMNKIIDYYGKQLDERRV
jgi:hypothetical protein